MNRISTPQCIDEDIKPNWVTIFLRQIRLKQWTKNLLVFASAIFAGDIFKVHSLFLACIAFISFSCSASVVYILNDIMDIEKDRLHPDKCKRPLPAGYLSFFEVSCMGLGLFCIMLISAGYLGYNFTGIIITYLFVNILYSSWLKHMVIIDVMIIALGFVLRAVAGAFAVNGELTPWFMLCTLMLSLFLALGKRRHELQLFGGDHNKQRKVLSFYSTKLIDQLITIVSAMTITSYSLYAATEVSASHHYMIVTIPLVIYGIFRYLYLIHVEGRGGKPEEILLKDRHIYGTLLFYLVMVIYIKTYLS